MSDLVTENLPLITSAPDGIKRLRGLILELAVRGKLVPQDPADEPASELLMRIETEKARLVKEGKIRKPKVVEPVGVDERPFQVPAGWPWVRLDELSILVTDGTHHTPNYLSAGVPFISVKDINGTTISFENCKYISEEEHIAINQRCNPERGDILICRIGTLGRPTIVDTSERFSLFVSVGLIKLLQEVPIARYLHLVLSSPLASQQYDEIKAGGSHTNKLNLGDIPKLKIPLPPLPEQHRIVARVDELMALCDRLEAEQTDAAEAHARLVDALLATLTTSRNPAECTAHWQRLSEHFDTLFTTEASIDALKQTVLQLAVMGRLVPQDPADEPASELLKRIEAEKARLVKEGKIRKPKVVEEVGEDKRPFDVPVGWEWVRVTQLGSVGTGATPARTNPAFFNPPEIPWLTSGETDKPFIYSTRQHVSPIALQHSNLTIFPVGSLVVAMYGQGKTRGQVTELLIPATTNQACAALVFPLQTTVLRKYVKLHFQKIYDEIRELAEGGAQPNLNVGKIAATLVPLPPLPEQHRIVAKVDELMTLCDRLKADLLEARRHETRIADVLTTIG